MFHHKKLRVSSADATHGIFHALVWCRPPTTTTSFPTGRNSYICSWLLLGGLHLLWPVLKQRSQLQHRCRASEGAFQTHGCANPGTRNPTAGLADGAKWAGGKRPTSPLLQHNIAALIAVGVKTRLRAVLTSSLLRMLPSDLVIKYYKRCSAEKEDRLCIVHLQGFLRNNAKSLENAPQVN